MQSHPRRQTSSQASQIMGALPPEDEGVEKLIVDTLDDLTYFSHPPPQTLGPGLLASVAFRRMDDVRPVLIEPPPVVLGTLKAFIGHVGSRRHRAHTPQPGVRSGSYGEEGLGHLLVGARGGSKAEARNNPGGIDRGEQAKTLVPPQAVGPTDVGIPGKPSVSSTLAVPDRHSRTVQRLIRTLSRLKKSYQVQEESLDEFCVEAQEAVELGAAGQGRKGVCEVALSVAVEVPLGGKPRPPSEDGEGGNLALRKGCLGAGPLLWRVGLAEVVDRNVKCGEEGVHVNHEESVPFLSGSGGKPTLERGHLPLKSSTDNSHQAFKHLGNDLLRPSFDFVPVYLLSAVFESVVGRDELRADAVLLELAFDVLDAAHVGQDGVELKALLEVTEVCLLRLVQPHGDLPRHVGLAVEPLAWEAHLEGILDGKTDIHHIDVVVGHAAGLLPEHPGDVVAVDVGVVEDKELVVTTFGMAEQVAHGLGRVTLATDDGHVVFLGEPRRFELGNLTLFFDVKNLVELVFGELVGGNLSSAKR